MKVKAYNRISFKKGSASIFVVIFATILLSIMSVGFLRIVLSENKQSTGNELSQSAYDSALSGTEDAKIALLKYHECLSQGYKASNKPSANECERLIYDMEKFIKDDSCDTVTKVLKRRVQDSGSVIIDSITQAGKSGDRISETLDQAYTCVKIKKEVRDYTSSLNADNRSRLVPLRIDNIDKVKSVVVSWYSIGRYDEWSSKGLVNTLRFHSKDSFEPHPSDPVNVFRPPTIKVDLFQANENFYLSDMNLNFKDRTNRGTLFLKPVNSSAGDHQINIKANTFAASNDKSFNDFANVVCDSRGSALNKSFMCSTAIQIPDTLRAGKKNQGASFLRVSLPYGDPSTEFNIKLCEDSVGSSCGISDFSNVQAIVDATGRASDFYRRIESRIELVDANFPYPDYSVQTPQSEFDKNFYATRNCWYQTSNSGDDGTHTGRCKNNKSNAP